MAASGKRLSVIIVGGGPAGYSAASFLREHHDVTLLERDGSFQNDYGISIVANAYGLLQKHGVQDDRIIHNVLTHLRMRSKDNESIADVQFDTRKTVGAPSVLTKRSEIVAEIRRLAEDTSRPGTPVRVITDAKVVNVDIPNARVETADGQSFTGDIIIGADGINSVVRSAIQKQDSHPEVQNWQARPSGLIAYMSAVPHSVFASDPDLSFQADLENAASLTTYYGTGGPGAKNRILVYPVTKDTFQVVAYYPETEWVSEFESSKRSIISGIPAERVLRDFQDFHPSVQKLLGYSPTSDVWRIRDLASDIPWTSGRAILIGDAVHAATPHTGHGANMAMEDGEALGYVLSDISKLDLDTPEKLDAAIQERFESFLSVRVKRSHYVQLCARQAGGIAAPEEGRFNPRAFSMNMHPYAGAKAALDSPSTQPSYSA